VDKLKASDMATPTGRGDAGRRNDMRKVLGESSGVLDFFDGVVKVDENMLLSEASASRRGVLGFDSGRLPEGRSTGSMSIGTNESCAVTVS